MKCEQRKVNVNGQVSLPYKIRHKYDIETGDQIDFVWADGFIFIFPPSLIEKLKKDSASLTVSQQL